MPESVQININVTEEDARLVDRMMTEDAYDNRSAFIRRLIRLEWARRQKSKEQEQKTQSQYSNV